MEHSLEATGKENIIKTISSYLCKNVEETIFAYLFGSFVTEGPFSDIDLGVFTIPELNRSLSYELNLEGKLERVVKYLVDVRVLNGAPLSFCFNVIRYGKLIVDRNRNLRTDFESRILRQYFDFAPFRRRYLAGVTDAPL